MSDAGLSSRPFRKRPWEHGNWALQPSLERIERRDKPFVRWIEEKTAFAVARIRLPQGNLRRFARKVVAEGKRLEPMDGPALSVEIDQLRLDLRADPASGPAVVRAFALIREVTFRKMSMRHYPSQIMAGRVLHDGSVAQLATGEGKTITGLLPVITAALSGLPAHVVTVNPYLAERDCETLRPVIETFGLSVGRIDTDMPPDDKRKQYACDVVFVTNKDLCFDYLRDIEARGDGPSHARQVLHRLGGTTLGKGPQPMQRGLHFALLDEVDLVLVDEARIPLVISAPRGEVEDEGDFRRALDLAGQLDRGPDYTIDTARKSADLTEAGKARLKRMTLNEPGLWQAERARVERVEQALAATHIYTRGHDYVVMEDDTVQIVDPHTGRVSEGRAWERGLHQLIELKEGVRLTGRSNTKAKITYQRFFRRYMKLAGMTGTAQGLDTEFWRVFGLRIRRIGTHRKIRRVDQGPRIYARSDDRWQEVATRALAISNGGGACLVGTLSVENSELIANAITQAAGAACDLQVLNALQDSEEALIVSRAGKAGALTIATSMAGRGTDISLDTAVKDSGGLHVLLTEPSESRRVDYQLRGRSGRQGDPGQTETLICFDDPLFRNHTPRLAKSVSATMQALRLRRLGGPLARMILAHAQGVAERRNARLRTATLRSDRDIGSMLGFAGRGE